MPRKSKKSKFRGVGKHILDNRSTPSTSSDIPATASYKKIGSSFVSEESHSLLNAESISSGYRLIDLDSLNAAVSRLHMCKDGSLTIVDEDTHSGLCSQLSFLCTVCGKKTFMSTSQRKKNCCDVNVRTSLAMCELGLGSKGMATICSVIGMPPPSVQSSWEMHNKNISVALSTSVDNEFANAANKLRQHLSKDDCDIDVNDIIDVVVSYDGTWHHRGFKSAHGVGVVISVDTGEVLDAEVVSKTCEVCQRSQYKKDSPEFEEWQKQHKEKGECFCNFDGPSTGMETAAATAIWSRSVQKHKMRYVALLSDGDNKTWQSLNALQPYGGNVEITKLECVNHIHKRMGTGLRNLLKSSSHIRGGSGGLTKNMMIKLSSYYRKNILDHITTSKDPDDIEDAVKTMKVNILASLHHSVAHKDPAEQHKYCMDSRVDWCSYKKDPQTKTQNKNKLPETFLPHMLPLYNRLSEENLLRRCVAGLTQNQNESFNSTLWRRCPKERNFGTASVKRALAFSVLCWNRGQHGLVGVLNELGLKMNIYTKNAIQKKDQQRLSDAGRLSDHKAKRRKLNKVPVSGDYLPGGY